VIEFPFTGQMQAASGENLYAFIGVADARMHHAKVFPFTGNVARFFLQFTPGRIDDGFTMIDLAGRQFEKDPTQRIAVLALEQQIAIVQERQDDNSTGMNNVFAD